MSTADPVIGFTQAQRHPPARATVRPTTRRRPQPTAPAVAAPAVAATEPAVRVLLCEGHEVYRIGLRTVLDASDDLAVVGEAASAAEVPALAHRLRPHVVVLGFGGPRAETVELVGELTRNSIGVVALAESSDDCPFSLLAAGARGYLLRPTASARLLDAVRVVARDESLLDASAAVSLQQLLSSPAPVFDQPSDSPSMLDELTIRQRDVVLLVAEGLSNAEIAARLHLGEATVKSHLAAVMRRYALRDRTQLAIMTLRLRAGLPRSADA